MVIMVIVALTFATNANASDMGQQRYSRILPRTRERVTYTLGSLAFRSFLISFSYSPCFFSCCGQVQGPGVALGEFFGFFFLVF
ncbi:MAG: hypothetical protein JOS17DRAFT_749737 [Linnemannia elongata]|nr:MAG: hypothetical protein JOS17DRAFT_749737 [Linnemannia elongata]